MHTFMRSLPPRKAIMEQVPLLARSLLVAGLFFKFHNFTLVALAFLASWFFEHDHEGKTEMANAESPIQTHFRVARIGRSSPRASENSDGWR